MVRFLSRLPIGFVVLALYPLTTSSGAAEAPRPEELLARYEAYVDGLRTIAFDSLEMVYETGGAFADRTWTWMVRSSYARAENRWRLRYHMVGLNYYKRVLPMNNIREDVFDGKSYLSVGRDDRGARELTSMDLTAARSLLEGKGIGPFRTDVTAEIDSEKPKAARRYFIRSEVADLYGYVNVDGITIGDMLQKEKSHLTSDRESIDDRTCDVLKGVTAYGTVTLWLDPASDYAPVRLRLRKEGDDLMDKTPMRKQKADDRKWARPNLPIRQYELQVDFRPKSIQGHTAPVSYVRRDRFVYEGGPEFLSHSEFTLDHIRFDPKPEDLEPTLTIPDDTPVYLINAPGIRAKWSGGKLVKTYDNAAVASLKGKWVSEDKTVPLWRRPLVVAIPVLLAVVGIVLAWRRRSAVTE